MSVNDARDREGVHRAVVNDDDLELDAALTAERHEATSQLPRAVTCGNHDGCEHWSRGSGAENASQPADVPLRVMSFEQIVDGPRVDSLLGQFPRRDAKQPGHEPVLVAWNQKPRATVLHPPR